MDEKLRNVMHYVLLNGEGVKEYVLNYPHYVQNNLNDTKTVIMSHWKSLIDKETDLISLWRIFSEYLLKLIASKECAGFLSIVFILFLCVLVNSTYDLKYYNMNSSGGQTNNDEDQNGDDDKFNSTPKSVLKKGASKLFTPIRSKSNSSQNGTPYSSVSTLTPDSNYKNMRSIMHRHSDSEHKSDENDPHSRLSGEDSDDNNSQYAPSEGTMMSGYSKIDFLMYENEIMKSAVDDPRVLIGWRVLVKGQGSGTVLSIKKIKFSTTKFVIQFDSGIVKTLALKRSDTKGKVPFTLITKINNN